MPARFALLEVVVLAKGIPEDGVPAGSLGVIVDLHQPPFTGYEVEVADGDGRTLWCGAVAHGDLRPYWSPGQAST